MRAVLIQKTCYVVPVTKITTIRTPRELSHLTPSRHHGILATALPKVSCIEGTLYPSFCRLLPSFLQAYTPSFLHPLLRSFPFLSLSFLYLRREDADDAAMARRVVAAMAPTIIPVPIHKSAAAADVLLLPSPRSAGTNRENCPILDETSSSLFRKLATSSFCNCTNRR
jgi:hypothetical protein